MIAIILPLCPEVIDFWVFIVLSSHFSANVLQKVEGIHTLTGSVSLPCSLDLFSLCIAKINVPTIY